MAADVTTGIKVYRADLGSHIEKNSPGPFKEIIVEVPDTADDGDTFTITLAEYGITSFRTIRGYAHTTKGSVMVEEAPTTAVAAGVLTVTIGGATDNLTRFYWIGGI